MTITKLTTSDLLHRWDQFVAEHPEGTFAQQSAWGQVKQQFGWQPEILVAEDRSRLVGGVQYLTKPLPLGQRMVYVPYGPLWLPDHLDVLAELLQKLKQRTAGAVAVKVEPHVGRAAFSGPPSQQPGIQAPLTQIKDTLVHSGFCSSRHMLQPEATLLLDTSQSEETLLTGMRQTTRRYIRQAERSGLRAELSPAQPEAVRRFYQLYQQVDRQKQFGIHTEEYYQVVAKAFGTQAHINFVCQQDQPLGAYFLLQVGNKAWELYGGSTSAGQPVRANYLLKWTSILAMKERGVRVYDQGGIAPLAADREASGHQLNFSAGSKQHALAGVTYFKAGFGGQPVEWIGSWDWSGRPWLYRLAALLGKV